MATKATQAPKQPADDAKHNVGKVVQVIGPVLDIEFEPERLPEIYNAVVIDHRGNGAPPIRLTAEVQQRSEEHTSELQSLAYLVCRLLLEKKKKSTQLTTCTRTNYH